MLAKASCGTLLRFHTQVHNTVLCELLATACCYYPMGIRTIALLGFRRTVKKPLLQILQRHELLKPMSGNTGPLCTLQSLSVCVPEHVTKSSGKNLYNDCFLPNVSIYKGASKNKVTNTLLPRTLF